MNLDLDTLGNTVLVLCQKKEFVAARSACNASFTLAKCDEDRASILNELAYIENAAGDLAASIALLKRARAFDSRNRAVLHELMISLINSGNYSDSRDASISLIDLDSQFPYQSFTSSAYFHLAYCCLLLGELENAESALAKSNYTEPIWIDGGLLSKWELSNLIETKRASYN